MDEKDKFKPINFLKNSDIKKNSAVFFLKKKEKKKIDFDLELPKIDEVIYILKKQKKERTQKDIKVLDEFLSTNLSYFRQLKSKSDPDQYEKTLYVLKYEEVKQGRNIVTFGDDGDKCYILLEGTVSIFKPTYHAESMTMREYIYYLKELDKKDPSTKTRQRIIQKNNHIEDDVLELLKEKNILKINNEREFNIFLENSEKIFEAKEGFSFGESALLHKQKRNATVTAEKLCKLIYIDKFDYNRVLKEIEKKRIEEDIKKFVKKFSFFSLWGYFNLNKLYSLMTDLQLFKNEFLYKQNEDSDYIYFCIDGTFEIYSLISFGWKKEYLKYISNSESNFFIKIDPQKYISDYKLMKIIKEAKNAVPKSPMILSEFYPGKFNIGLIEQNDIDELIINKEEKFSNPFDLFKVSMNNLDSSGILGLVEAVEFKKRFTSIKVKSKTATLKRIKASDFFRVLVNNHGYERNDELMLNYICEKKKLLIKQIFLSYKYRKNMQINKYIEEYKKCHNIINYKKPINKSFSNYINTLSSNPTNINSTKNIFLNKSKLANPISLDLNFASFDLTNNNKKNNLNESKRSKRYSKIRPFSTSNDKIFIKNIGNKNLILENKKKIKDLKLSSFSPNLKKQKNIKLKEEIRNFSNYETTMSLSNFSNFHKNLSNKNIINNKQNLISLIKNKNDETIKSRNFERMKLEKNNIFSDKIPSFKVKNYKKNLYFKCGFFINEIIKLGLGPNIPLRKEIMFLNNDKGSEKNLLKIESSHSNSKAFSLEVDERKRRNNFLKITKL